MESQCLGCEWTLSGSISRAVKHITLAIPASPDGGRTTCADEPVLYVAQIQARAVSSILFERAADHV